MRYYTIDILKDGKIVKTYTSFKNNITIPGALNIEMDIPVYELGLPMGMAYLKIWGISLQDISSATDLANFDINVYAGMQKGLPLANPKQNGLILNGTIYQAFGNWQDTNMTLDFVIYPNIGTSNEPKNIVFTWAKGAFIGDAIKQALATPFPNYKPNISVNPGLVASENFTGYYDSVIQLAKDLNTISSSIVKKKNYRGISVTVQENAFNVYDGTTITEPKKIEFTDIIGQCTWIDFATVQFKAIMRADLKVGDYVKLPPGQVTLGAQSFASLKDKLTFNTTSNAFQIIRIRHVGNFRQADASAWVTVIDCVIT